MTTNEYRELVHEATKEFSVDKAIETIKAWIADYAEQSGMKKAVLGISGGKDSTVVAKLLVDVLGAENVYGLLMPNGLQKDLDDALRVVELVGIKHEVCNIRETYDAIVGCLGGIKNISTEADINIAPRIRMMTLYTYGQTHGCRVAGTGNLSERTLGYFTKWGDGASDFNVLANLTSLEVMRIGEALGLPLDLVYKTPTDGLSGMSDEEKLGISYIDMHMFLRDYDRALEELSDETIERICTMRDRAGHKLTGVPTVEF